MSKQVPKSKRSRAGAPERSPREHLSRAFVVTSTLLLSGGLVFGLFWGLDGLEARASTLIADRSVKVEFTWPPLPGHADATWLPEQIRADLMDIAYMHLGEADRAPFRVDAIRALSMSLMDTGWFESPPRAERHGPGIVTVDGTWRIPAAVVRGPAKDHLVSWNAELLPALYEQGMSGQRVIVGAEAAAPTDEFGRPGLGKVWEGEDIRAGLSLLSTLRGTGYWRQVAGVDVSELATKKRLTILTDTGSRVVWGSAPGVRTFGDQTDEVKLARLDTLFKRWGRIDAGRRIVEVYGPIVLVDDRPEGQ